MATDYAKIREEHKEGYGPWYKDIGEHFHKHFYSDPTHFIFELLQNTEDALKQAGVKEGDVQFTLQSNKLSLSHNGKPFNEADVRSICRFGNSTKKTNGVENDNTKTIGKFGIGFKSVYDFTNTPKIFSGDEHFKIEDYILPYDAIPPTDLKKNETRIILPFHQSNEQRAFNKINRGLNKLRGHHIIFLRHIKTLKWKVENNDPLYITQEEEKIDDLARRITITDHDGTKETWLIFLKGERVENFVEIAFLQKEFNPETGKWKFDTVLGGKTLYSYFPVYAETTDLKFLVQGAFQTTKNRAELTPEEEEEADNAELIKHASDLLIEILFWLKNHEKLDWNVFNCLPIGDEFLDPEHHFSGMAEKIRNALRTEELLPTQEGGFVSAEHARFSPQTRELTKIFDDKKISELFNNKPLQWLEDISSEEFRDVRKFLSDSLDIKTLSLSGIMRKEHITKAFMERQSDGWIRNLYTFLLERSFYPKPKKPKNEIDYYYDRNKPYSETPKTLPLIRLKDGEHICSHDENDKPKVYLPSPREHPKTIKPTTINTKESETFINRLGIETYDDTDDLIERLEQAHTLDLSKPKQRKQYENDIKRIVTIQKDKKPDKERFVGRLKRINFVSAKNMETDEMTWKRPEEVYLATDEFKTLFDGVEAYLVDDALMTKDGVSEILVQCGAKNCLKHLPIRCHLPLKVQNKKLLDEGFDDSDTNERRQDPHYNHDIEHLEAVIDSFHNTPEEERKNKAKILWEELGKIESKYAKAQTFYSRDRFIRYDARFIDILNNKEWIPTPDGTPTTPKGTPKRPDFFLFSELRWEPPKAVQNEIRFKKSGEEEALDLLGFDENATKREKRIKEIDEKRAKGMHISPEDARWYDRVTELPPDPDEDAPPKKPDEKATSEDIGPTPAPTASSRVQPPIGTRRGQGHQRRTPPTTPPPGTTGRRGGGVANPAVEKAAIDYVREKFKLEDANDEIRNNPGFDLYEVDEEGKPIKWFEVKGKAGVHDGIPRMTSTQFGFALGLNALGEGHKYIHITVAHALTNNPELIEVPDPADEEHIIDNEEEIDNSNDD